MGSIQVLMAAANRTTHDQGNALPGLRKRWFGLFSIVSLLLWVSYHSLQFWWTTQYATRWLGLAAFFSLLLLWTIWRGLVYNYRPNEGELLPSLGMGNQLTIVRGVMVAFLAGFLFSPWPEGWLAWVPGFFYLLAVIFDLFDGYLARRYDHVTRLGEILDMKLDGLGVFIACALIVQYGQVPAWFLLVGLARYLYLAGIWVRRRFGKPVYELESNSTRRPFAGAQMGFIAVVLFPVFSPPGTALVALLFALPFLVGFTRDWLTASGVIKSGIHLPNAAITGSAAGLRISLGLWQSGKHLLIKWMPVALRIFLVFFLAFWMQKNLSGIMVQGINDLFSQSGIISSSNPWLGLVFLLAVVGLIMTALGAAGRIAALLVIFAAGIFQQFFGLSLSEVLIVVSATALFYLGTGPFSLWMPERGIITKRIGEV